MAELREQFRRKIVEKLEEKVGRPATSVKETRVRAAASEVLSGKATMAQAGRAYAVTYHDIQHFLEKTFPNEEDRYKFLEEAMIGNSVLSMKRFAESYETMDAIDAARAATMFAGKAAELRKARLDGFKEPPIGVNLIISLERNLQKLTEKNG